jgi:hypothetical protein
MQFCIIMRPPSYRLLPLLLLFGSLAISLLSFAQPCTGSDDLLAVPGWLRNHTHTPIGGGSFTAAEKGMGMKTLIAVENHCLKNLRVTGGNTDAWFSVWNQDYFDRWRYSSYAVNIGFYQFSCVNGKKVNSTEFGVDFSVTANFSLHSKYQLFSGPTIPLFRQDRALYGEAPITYLRYYRIPASVAEKINNGEPFDEAYGNYFNYTDIVRSWYVTKKGTALLIAVTRKEYLESLIEYYGREKIMRAQSLNRLLTESERYMAQYQKSGNAAMYQNHQENKQKAEKGLAELDEVFRLKTEKAREPLLNESADWLQEPATVTASQHQLCPDDRDARTCLLFTGFASGADAEGVYRFNTDLAQKNKAQPGKPLFFRVKFRFKEGHKFSRQILEGYVNNFDFEALRTML